MSQKCHKRNLTSPESYRHLLVELVLERAPLACHPAPVSLGVDPRVDAFCPGPRSLPFEIVILVASQMLGFSMSRL
jgi:hypothetical protein